MDLNRIIQMIINQLLRRAVNTGVDVAIKQVSRGSAPANATEDAQRREAAQAARRARQAAKLTRKL